MPFKKNETTSRPLATLAAAVPRRPLVLSAAMRDVAQRAAAAQPRLSSISHRRWDGVASRVLFG